MIEERLLEEIIRRIVDVAQPERIIVFGSAAAGCMTPDSDIDLLVIERSPANIMHESVRIGNALRGLGFPFDVIVMASEKFEERKDIFGGVAYPANKYGKLIYEAA